LTSGGPATRSTTNPAGTVSTGPLVAIDGCARGAANAIATIAPIAPRTIVGFMGCSVLAGLKAGLTRAQHTINAWT
jgi:hypothetical protein